MVNGYGIGKINIKVVERLIFDQDLPFASHPNNLPIDHGGWNTRWRI